MGIPIPVQPTPLPATDKQIERAEQILDALVRVVAHGTTGASVNTPPTYSQVPGQDPSNLVLEKPEQQTFFRQLATVLSVMEASSGGGSSPSEFTVNCSPSDQVGDFVYAVADGTVAKADITTWDKMPAVGCIISKTSPTQCVVQTANMVPLYSGLAVGKVYFLGYNGRPVSPRPVPSPGSGIFLQSIGFAVSPTTLMIGLGSSIYKVFT